MNAELHELFPVPVMIFKRFAEASTEFHLAKEQEFMKSIDNHTSVVNEVLDYHALADLKNFCKSSIDYYCSNVLKTEQSLRITTSWITKTESNESHHRHTHKNSILSGVYYWEDSIKSPLIFENPNIDKSNFDLKCRTHDRLNSENYLLGVENNCLIIFPSWLYHSVNTVLEDRYSLAFNTFFKTDAEYGNKRFLTQVRT